MKSRLTAFAVLTMLALTLSACGPMGLGQVPNTGGQTPTTGLAATMPAAATAVSKVAATAMPPAATALSGIAATAMPPAATSASGAATAMATVAATAMSKTGVAQVMVSSNPKFGMILTDAQGRTLYLLTKDGNNMPTCYAACAQLWPPLLANGASMAGAGLDASKLGTAMRTDGGTQVTFNGHPLYYFAQDMNPGDTNGQGFGGVWFVVSQSGDPIH